MPRYRLTLEYDGGPFQGWQRQSNGPSVQASLEEAIEAFCGERTQVVGAGRTARMRHYRYRIVNRRPPLALDRGRAWQVPGRLDVEMMHEAAQRLVGRHDFTSFRSALCQAQSPIKTLSQMTVVRQGDQVELSARARSFLHHQVRNMVGTLKLIGEGRWPVERIEEALAARDRAAAGPTAPACGLYLMRVDY
ncbi:MAG: truA [Geminicoccaceae bacterium]|nr:truA [Geminicoccaceae bacterium]